MRGLEQPHDPNLLVGFNLADDAGVYQLTPEIALVQTTDIFTPVVDDPFAYGQIAAANSLSDIYAMGAKPITALNIAAFPRTALPFEVLGEILRGGLDKTIEAGVTILGGHTVDNPEPLYGMAITGTVHPGHIASNAGARDGDVLFLTKSLGTGIISTAIKREACPDEVAQAAITSMATLNRAACEAMVAVGIGNAVHACTDVTGFGLMGHAAEMARASEVVLEFVADAIPLLPGLQDLAQDDEFVPGGGVRNQQHLTGFVELPSTLAPPIRFALFDPQTSGGLLIAVAPEYSGQLEHELQSRGVAPIVVGRVRDGAARLVIIG